MARTVIGEIVCGNMDLTRIDNLVRTLNRELQALTSEYSMGWIAKAVEAGEGGEIAQPVRAWVGLPADRQGIWMEVHFRGTIEDPNQLDNIVRAIEREVQAAAPELNWWKVSMELEVGDPSLRDVVA